MPLIFFLNQLHTWALVLDIFILKKVQHGGKTSFMSSLEKKKAGI